MSIIVFPNKYYSPLFVDSYTIEIFEFSLQFFKVVRRRDYKVIDILRVI